MVITNKSYYRALSINLTGEGHSGQRQTLCSEATEGQRREVGGFPTVASLLDLHGAF